MAEHSEKVGGANGPDDAYEFTLAEALGRLDTGAEPPMPDLVPDAVAHGTRIRRRRGALATAGSVLVASAVLLAGYSVLTPTPTARRPMPAASVPTIRYPTLQLLRSVIPPGAGTIEAPDVDLPRRTAGYFRFTDRTGQVSDLYVAITPPVTTPAASGRSTLCEDAAGRPLVTPWGGRLQKCSRIPTKSGINLLMYSVERSALPTPGATRPGSFVLGFVAFASDESTVQAIVGPHDGSRPDSGPNQPTINLVQQLVTDPRLLGTGEQTGG